MDLGQISNLLNHFRLGRNYRKMYLLSGAYGDIDAYTGGLAELPVQGGLVMLFLLGASGIHTRTGIYSE